MDEGESLFPRLRTFGRGLKMPVGAWALPLALGVPSPLERFLSAIGFVSPCRSQQRIGEWERETINEETRAQRRASTCCDETATGCRVTHKRSERLNNSSRGQRGWSQREHGDCT